jgi:ribonucleoside-diphosphate reductase alpha chain
MLIKLEIPYDSDEAIVLAEKIMRFIDHESKKASMGLAERRGVFPNYSKSRFKHKIRNATTTTIAPTGSLSIIADTTSSIEPLFAVNYRKMILGKKGIVFRSKMYSVLAKKFKGNKLKGGKAKLANLFKTAYEIRPEQHIKIQAAFQEFTDNAVSKTVNLPSHASRKDVEKIFLLAYALKCKGITVYRQGSHKEEIIKECKECKF